MRPIDAEELKRSIAVSALIEDQKTLEQIIDEQPTIEERKKGKWIDTETSYADVARQYCRCSVCGVLSPRPLGDFCRWCGADMRGE